MSNCPRRSHHWHIVRLMVLRLHDALGATACGEVRRALPLSGARLRTSPVAFAGGIHCHPSYQTIWAPSRRVCARQWMGSWAAMGSICKVLPWVANHGLGLDAIGSMGMSAVVTAKSASLHAVSCLTGSWEALTVWTLASMLLYVARRSYLHGLKKRVVLSRHFLNGYDEAPHPHFMVAFVGWLVFLVVYVPMELCFFLFARCSVFYY